MLAFFGRVMNDKSNMNGQSGPEQRELAVDLRLRIDRLGLATLQPGDVVEMNAKTPEGEPLLYVFTAQQQGNNPLGVLRVLGNDGQELFHDTVTLQGGFCETPGHREFGAVATDSLRRGYTVSVNIVARDGYERVCDMEGVVETISVLSEKASKKEQAVLDLAHKAVASVI